jgi:2-dehydropantoate 2-reductase
VNPAKEKELRIIVYGAGGIGGVIGGHLGRIGEKVMLVGRQAHVDAINSHGLSLVTPSGVSVVKVPAVTRPADIAFGPEDIVFLTMKGQDTDASLRELKSVARDVPVFCFQNGVRNEEIAASYFRNVYGVMVRVGAVYVKAGEVVARRDPPGWLVIGKYPKGSDAIVDSVAEVLRKAGFLVMVSEDVIPYKWGKLILNLSNAPEAITDSKDGAVDIISQAAEHEAEMLLDKAGIRWVASKDVEEQWPEITKVRGRVKIEAGDSTWQSLTRGTGTIETEFINGEVVRLAKRIGGRAPINEGILRIALEMAARHNAPGKYTPVQLCKILGIDC